VLGPPFSAPLENAYQFSSRVTGAEISTEKRTMKMGGWDGWLGGW